MKNLCLWLLPLLVLLHACGEEKPAQTEVLVEVPPPQIDSVQLQVEEYQRQLETAKDDINRSLQRLNAVSAQLQDSIEHTQVPPQLQEETISSYKNRLSEVQQVQSLLRQWQQRDIVAPDSLSTQEKKVYLEEQLRHLERLQQETRSVRREAQETMQESDRDEY